MAFEQTLFLIGFIAIIFLGLGVPCIVMFSRARRERKSNEEHQQFIDSIKPGDIFDWDDRDKHPYKNPFDDTDNSHLRTTIIDIKTNEAGVKWVKYCFTKNINYPNHGTWSDEINNFLRCRTRISRRIDNINTNE